MKPIAYRIMEETEESYWWFRARRKILCGVIKRLLPQQSEIVDFGCGTGSIASELRDLGYRVVAADIAEEALAVCRLRGLGTVDLSRERLADGGADCILAGDVLEHVKDDVELLVQLRRSLRPGGLMIAAVPAFEFLWSGEDYVSEHVRRYTRSTLKRSMRLSGFDPVWCSYFNVLLFPVIATVVLGKRIFFPRDMYRSNVVPLPEWQNEILYRLFAFEGHLLKWLRFPVGASLLVVAKPSINLSLGGQGCASCRPE